MSANDWQSPLPPPPTWDANTPGFDRGDDGRQDASLTGWNASGKGYKGWCHTIHGILGSRSDTEVGLPGTWSTIETLVTRDQFLATRHQHSCDQQGVKLYKALPLGTIGRSLADQFSEDQICSGQGFDLIIGAIRHHFRSYLEAEPEVQADIDLYQSSRSPKGTFVNTRRESATNFEKWRVVSKRLFRQKLKGFIVKRQAKLTHDQAKHLHFYIPTRGLEGRQDGDALNRLDQTDALVEQILGDRAKLGAPCQSWSGAAKKPSAGVSDGS